MEIILVVILVGALLFTMKARGSAWTSYSDDLIARKKAEDNRMQEVRTET